MRIIDLFISCRITNDKIQELLSYIILLSNLDEYFFRFSWYGKNSPEQETGYIQNNNAINQIFGMSKQSSHHYDFLETAIISRICINEKNNSYSTYLVFVNDVDFKNEFDFFRRLKSYSGESLVLVATSLISQYLNKEDSFLIDINNSSWCSETINLIMNNQICKEEISSGRLTCDLSQLYWICATCYTGILILSS